MNLGLLLLLIAAVRHYAWQLAPHELAGMASKGLGAVAIMALLAVVWHLAKRSDILAAVLLYWAWEEAQTAICSAWYIAEPWSVPTGEAICSAKAGIDFGAIGICFVAILAYLLVRTDSTQQMTEPKQ